MSRWPVHPAAAVFPKMDAKAFKELVEDIRAYGLLEPIVIYHGELVDGRHRLRACEELGIEPRTIEWTGKGSVVDWIRSVNEKRRHLTPSQLAAVTVDLKPIYAAEARERMRQAAIEQRRRDAASKITLGDGNAQGCPSLDTPGSDDGLADIQEPKANAVRAAEHDGASKSYVARAEKIKAADPALFEQVRDGKITVYKADKTIRHRDEQAERQAVLEANAILPNGERRQVAVGDWWQLGEHLVYCGDTSKPEFIERCPDAAFAFADPPYGVGKAEWDSELIWDHDWLADKAKIVAVTPGSTHLQDFLGLTSMPYKWPLACLISNGMTKGAVGFANWILTIVFAHESVNRSKQDATTITIDNKQAGETTHPSRKPAALMAWLLQTFTKEGDTVLDPFLGSGTTLMAAHALGRRCVGGEVEPAYVDEIIGRWEALTEQKAIKVEPNKV